MCTDINIIKKVLVGESIMTQVISFNIIIFNFSVKHKDKLLNEVNF